MTPNTYHLARGTLALLAVSFSFAMARGAAAAQQSEDLRLWYRQPAGEWVEALPIGNGRLGAMVFGGTQSERIQFNEDTLWIGEPHDYSHPGAAEHLPTIRTLLFEGKQRDAERLAMEHFMSVPLRQMPYQPFGDLKLRFAGHDKASEYRRELDIDEAVATVQYEVEGVAFTREVFASAPDDVIVFGSPPTSRARSTSLPRSRARMPILPRWPSAKDSLLYAVAWARCTSGRTWRLRSL